MFPKIFQGVRILDFSRLLPGPFVSDLLIQMGAEVTCVLSPKGDPLLGSYSPFESLKKGKNFLTLDLKKPEGLKEAKKLLASSAILLEGFRPETMEKLGLGFEEAKKVQPEILYVSVTGYWQGHPKFLKGAHDLNFLIDSGIYSLLYSDSLEEVPVLQLADVFGGFYAAFQILTEWVQRVVQPRPKHLRVSIVEGLKLLAEYLQGSDISSLLPFLTGHLARYRIYRTQDGHRLMVAALEPKFFEALLKVLDLQAEAGEAEAELAAKIGKKISGKTLQEWKEIFRDVDACISFIPNRGEVLK